MQQKCEEQHYRAMYRLLVRLQQKFLEVLGAICGTKEAVYYHIKMLLHSLRVVNEAVKYLHSMNSAAMRN